MTAASVGLLSCHTCALLSRGGAHCPRCGSTLHLRKPDSVTRTWAYLIALVVLYIPANTLPIMETNSLYGAQRDTILSGVVFLWRTGSWHLALIVFIASVLVPLLKMLAIGLLLVSVQRRSTRQPGERLRLYRIVELIGRWCRGCQRQGLRRARCGTQQGARCAQRRDRAGHPCLRTGA
jgi:paraquat-inducible protein A